MYKYSRGNKLGDSLVDTKGEVPDSKMWGQGRLGRGTAGANTRRRQNWGHFRNPGKAGELWRRDSEREGLRGM